MGADQYTGDDPYRDEKLSGTVKFKEKYRQSRPAGYDGHFAWEWTKGCFGSERMSPMDLDGMVEKGGNFLIFETKDRGKEIPRGQWITFNSLYSLRCFSVVWLYGKLDPTHIKYWPALAWGGEKHEGAPTHEDMEEVTVEAAREIVRGWYNKAEKDTYPYSQRGAVDIAHIQRHRAELGARLLQTEAALHSVSDAFAAGDAIQAEAALHGVYDALAGGEAWRPPGIAGSRDW